MDSISQITLGAAVGELTLGKKVGNKAMVWGGVAGIIPDLDVLMSPFLSDIGNLVYHRGFSHSIAFAVLFAPLLGWLISKVHRQSGATWNQWATLAFWCLVTHPLLDSLTVWGTQLFLPYSDYRVALNSIFIIDPLYTVPFLLFLIAAAFVRRDRVLRRRLNMIGLVWSTGYLMLGLGIKHHVNGVFERSLQAQSISYSSYITNPSPLNTIFWLAVAEGPDGFWQGNYSLLDVNQEIDWRFVPKNHHLLQPYRYAWDVDRLFWAAHGYIATEELDGKLILNDLRFGQSDAGLLGGQPFVFSYELHSNGPGEGSSDGVRLVRRQRFFAADDNLLQLFARRILGYKPAATP